MSESIPLLEFDPGREAIIEPVKAIKHRDVPEHCVLCFFKEVIEKESGRFDWARLHPQKSEMGEMPVYSTTFEGLEMGVAQAAVGAPLAASFFDELIARGGRKFVVCGGAAVLDSSIDDGDIVVPDSAIRDEGTSYHYLPAEREARPSPVALKAITDTLEHHKCHYIVGKTWTTDAFYRETPGKVARRRGQGCLTVEMEASAFFAVAEFRGVQAAQLLYGGDDVSGVEWDPRGFGTNLSARNALFWLAMEACARIQVA